MAGTGKRRRAWWCDTKGKAGKSRPFFGQSMSDRIRTIRLYGHLGTKYGRVYRLAVRNAREAIQALCAMVPGFQAELMSSRDRGVVYALFNGKRNLAFDELDSPPGRDDIRIAPVLQGSKRGGVLQTIVGAVLTVVGVFTAEFDGGTTMSVGIAMMAGGAVQMLSPQKSSTSSQDQSGSQASYNFNGPLNTSAQGNPVSLGYGRAMGGSAVISAGIFSEDQA